MTNTIEIQNTIMYAGCQMTFQFEVESIDEAQSILDQAKMRGITSCALHLNNKHQIYFEVPDDKEQVCEARQRTQEEMQSETQAEKDVYGIAYEGVGRR